MESTSGLKRSSIMQMALRSSQKGEKYLEHFEEGVYSCQICDNKLFSSADKFKSTKGNRPSFRQPCYEKAVTVKEDTTFGVAERGVFCFNCTTALGAVYDDAAEAGDTSDNADKRYAIYSSGLKFNKGEVMGNAAVVPVKVHEVKPKRKVVEKPSFSKPLNLENPIKKPPPQQNREGWGIGRKLLKCSYVLLFTSPAIVAAIQKIRNRS